MTKLRWHLHLPRYGDFRGSAAKQVLRDMFVSQGLVSVWPEPETKTELLLRQFELLKMPGKRLVVTREPRHLRAKRSKYQSLLRGLGARTPARRTFRREMPTIQEILTTPAPRQVRLVQRIPYDLEP